MLGSRTLNIAIFLLWTAAMSWLVATKILPTYRSGKPPKYKAVFTEEDQGAVDTGWSILLAGKPVGWSVTRVEKGEAGALTVLSRLHLVKLPFNEIAAGFLGSLLKNEFQSDISAQVSTQMYTGDDGRLVRFHSTIQLEDMDELISLEGAAHDKSLDLIARCGSVRMPTRIPFDNNVVLTDELSPVSMMPDLRVGQSWTQPVISPLRPPNAPSEVLRAVVERSDLIAWNGEPISTYVVVYRSASAAAPAGQPPLSELWVRSDGLVLRHSVRLGKGQLQFMRLGDKETERLAKEAFAEFTSEPFAAARPIQNEGGQNDDRNDESVAPKSTDDQSLGELQLESQAVE